MTGWLESSGLLVDTAAVLLNEVLVAEFGMGLIGVVRSTTLRLAVGRESGLLWSGSDKPYVGKKCAGT